MTCPPTWHSFCMARRRMPRRRFRRYRRRRYGRRVYRRRAQAQQRTKSRFVVKTTTVSNIVIAPSAPGITADASYPNYGGTASLSVFNNLVKSSYFTSIAKMYDAVRLDWVKVKITPTTSVLLQDQKQAVFVSAWDRNGLTNPKEPPNFAEIASYSSAFQRAINLQATSWSATRKIFATSVAEKSFFVPTSSVLSLTGNKMLSTGFNLGVGQSLVIPWNPQLLLGVLLSASTYNGASFAYPALDNTQTWNFICEFEWGLTFKGLRYDRPEGGAPLAMRPFLLILPLRRHLGSIRVISMKTQSNISVRFYLYLHFSTSDVSS